MYNFNQCNMNFKLKTPKSQSSSLILFYVNLPDGSRFVYSTGQKILVRLWDCHAQLPKKTKSQNDQLIVNTVNFRLNIIKSSFLKLYMVCKAIGKTLSKQLLKQVFDIQFKGVKKRRHQIALMISVQWKMMKLGKWSISSMMKLLP